MRLCLIFSHIFLFCLAFQASVFLNNSSLSHDFDDQGDLQQETPQNKSDKKTSHRIIVFIHGTILPAPSLNGLRKVAAQALTDGTNKPKILYQSYLDGRRHKRGFYGYQPFGEKGLTHIEDVYSDECSYTEASKLLRDIFVQTKKADDSFQESCSCYTFGWDGRLEHENRIEWAKCLYSALSDEVKSVQETCGADEVEVDIFAHSHGGNVALNMAPVQQELSGELSINRLVMLGTPVQVETEKYVLDPMFKNVYLFYSQGDMIQVSDVFSTKGFSKRRFDGEAEKNKVIHVEVQIDKKNPSHSELWSYGMVGQMLYRKSLSIYPFPVVAFVPEIFKTFHQELVPGATVCIDICRQLRYRKMIGAQEPLDIISILCLEPNSGIRKSAIISVGNIPKSNKVFLALPPREVSS
ncbi:hypothetical protein JST56_02235 [Candidatus Dependentiae bacterium]|nr:hypothetical protein [Candidatus Dependentiae bacterium]